MKRFRTNEIDDTILQSLSLGRAQSINQILQTTFQILTYEKVSVSLSSEEIHSSHFRLQQRQPDLLGASVFGPNEIYARLKTYKTSLLKACPSGTL